MNVRSVVENKIAKKVWCLVLNRYDQGKFYNHSRTAKC